MTPEVKTNTLTVLRTARGLISNGWTRRTFGQTADGQAVSYAYPGAVAFCALGALFKAQDGSSRNGRSDAQLALMAVVPDKRGLIAYNDVHAKDKFDILGLYDDAIAFVEATQ